MNGVKGNLHIMTLDKAFDLLSGLDIKDDKINEALEFIEDLAEGFYYSHKDLGISYDPNDKMICIERTDTPTNGRVKTWYDVKNDYEIIKHACQNCVESDDEELQDSYEEFSHKMNMDNIREYGHCLPKEFLERTDEEDYKKNYEM